MKINILNDNGTQTEHTISLKDNSTNMVEKPTVICEHSKEKTFLKIIEAYKNNQKAILYDGTNKQIETSLDQLDIQWLQKQPFSMMFFTSGTTGKPVGAFKTKANLEEEIIVLSQMLKVYGIKKVIVTVPFLHIYGLLMGILFPVLNDIDIVLKEHFLPNDLVNIIDDNSLVVTTPLYIKALNKLSVQKDLSSSLFVSSTAPLDAKNAKEFHEKYQANIMQLFGSTETGGIAYKFNDESLWTPLDKVELSVNDEQELQVQSPFVSNTLFELELKNTNGIIQTFDYVEFEQRRFKLVGRSSQVLKISGKRYSTIHIEELLESHESIERAMVFVKEDKNALRDEVLDITLQSKTVLSNKEIKLFLKRQLSNLKFNIDVHYVNKIEISNVGKKRRGLS